MKWDEKALQQWLLDFIYPLPDELQTAEEWEKAYHYDLAGMTPAERFRDRERLRLRLVLDERPHDWFGERWTRLKEAGDE